MKKVIERIAATAILMIITSSIYFYKNVQFDRHCSGWLKLAADANTIDKALERLDKAITYLEQNHITSGTTAVLWTSPDRDIKQWYDNLKLAQKNLHDFPKDATEADINTTLVKLRETLLDRGTNGHDTVTTPPEIELYPHNVLWFFLGWGSVMLFIGGIIYGCAELIRLEP